MNRSTIGSFAAVALAAFATGACAKTAAPFDTLKTANLTAYRLQNYEPPSPVPGAPIPGAPGAGIPGLPPEITQWVQGGAGGLQQLLPPGLLPPGMFGGQQQQGQQPAAPQLPGVPDPTPRFHGFRILQQTPVLDPDLKEELAKILGKEKNFDSKHANCLYAEMGLSFVPGPGAIANDVLISYSCNQVAARNFAWPHPHTGMTPSAVEDLSKAVAQLWPPGT